MGSSAVQFYKQLQIAAKIEYLEMKVSDPLLEALCAYTETL